MKKTSPSGGYRLTALLLIAVFALAGAVSVALTERYGLRLDLTENRLYTLSAQTEQIVSALEQDVSITVMNAEAEFPLLPRNLLSRYSLCGERLTVSYCDPYRDPRTVQTYTQLGYDVQQDDLMIQSGGHIRQLHLADLYELQGDGSRIERLVAEQRITSAIHQVTRDARASVLFADGHGERPSASLMELFETNQYAAAYTTISVLGIDPDAAALVICAPQRDFSEADIAALDGYLSAGGSVMVFAQPGMDGLPNLSAFLRDWGIGLTDGVVRETDLYVSGSDTSIAATYAAHDINAFFTNNRYFVITPSCMPLEQTFIRQGTVRTQQVLRSSANAFVSDGRQGPFALALTAQRTSAADGSNTGRLFAVGSMLVYGDDLLAAPSVANRDFLTQAIGWCTGGEALISIPAKELTQPFLPIVAGEARLIAALMTVALPLLILLTGALIWLRRRYL